MYYDEVAKSEPCERHVTKDDIKRQKARMKTLKTNIANFKALIDSEYLESLNDRNYKFAVLGELVWTLDKHKMELKHMKIQKARHDQTQKELDELKKLQKAQKGGN